MQTLHRLRQFKKFARAHVFSSSPFLLKEEKTSKLCRSHDHELPENRLHYCSIRHSFGLGMLIEDMQLHGLSANTQDVYVRAVRQVIEYED